MALREWIAADGAKTAYIEPDSPWENGYCESFMYGRPLLCKVYGEAEQHTGRVRSCIRPLLAANLYDRWP